MGGSSFSADDYIRSTASYKTKSRSEIFSSRNMSDLMDPSKMKNMVRESCDSTDNPNSTPIIIGLDVTGSMGSIPEYMIREGLGSLFTEIYDRKPVTDPQVLFSGFGDSYYDRAPLQVGQFESQCELLIKSLENVWLEGGGGGNNFETPDLVYYFAANHTKHDALLKRGQKGFIFTMSDEPPNKLLKRDHLQSIFGEAPQSDISFEQVLNQVSNSYTPYHIVIAQGSHCRYGDRFDNVLSQWRDLLGQNVIVCDDYTKISEIIVSILEVNSGKDVEEVINSWDGSTSITVKTAINSLSTTKEEKSLVF